jgi:hypothetical protein
MATTVINNLSSFHRLLTPDSIDSSRYSTPQNCIAGVHHASSHSSWPVWVASHPIRPRDLLLHGSHHCYQTSPSLSLLLSLSALSTCPLSCLPSRYVRHKTRISCCQNPAQGGQGAQDLALALLRPSASLTPAAEAGMDPSSCAALACMSSMVVGQSQRCQDVWMEL